MRSLDDIRSSLSLRRFLIELNVQMDAVNKWTEENGTKDHFSSLNHEYFINDKLPLIVTDILHLEDRRFFRHRGFEMRAIARGLKRYLRYRKLGGVSTIDQLLVRTYLQRRERTLARKLREITLAVLLNFHQTKYEILIAFVNCAYFGPGLNGADTTAEVIFGKRARDLNQDQSAFVASLLPYPLPQNIKIELRKYGPADHSDEILDKYAESNPWWVSRIKKRMEYLAVLRLKH